MTAIFSDVYIWVALLFFILSISGMFWILKSLQKRPDFVTLPHPPAFGGEDLPLPLGEGSRRGEGGLEAMGRQIVQIEETLSKIEKKLNEQNTDQLNEMAGQMKLIVQMLKTIYTSAIGDSTGSIQQKVEKIYQILSTLSSSDPK